MAALPLWLAALALLAPAPAASQDGSFSETVATSRPALAAIALSIRSRAIQDSRCYLMNGGAVESFFISEDTPVGSVIGTLSVNGDPREQGGNISLSLQEKNAAVGIAPGSKNLTLLRALDREERLGPSSVYVNVRCDRRHTADPSFVIPVSVRVWDVNDNAPAWLGAPFRARVSELAAAGARLLAAAAADPDQPGPHATIHYSVLPGPGSEYIGFANELDSTLVVRKPLDYETLNNFTVRLRAQDQGAPPLHNDTTLLVTVLDADDQNPRFSHEHYTAVVPDDAQDGTILETSPGPISAMDQDIGINAPLHYSITGDGVGLLHVDKDTGRVAATAQLLDEDSPVTIVIKATQVDNPDRYALATLTISRRGDAVSRPVQFAKRGYTAAVPEDAPPGTVLATLHTEPRPHRGRHATPLQFYVSDRSFLEKFAINSAGELLLRRPLDYETTDSYHYQVMVTDGVANDTASINISVQNVNEWEPRFRYPQYEFRVDAPPATPAAAPGDPLDPPGNPSAAPPGLLPVGKLEVFDGDRPDTVTLTLRGPDASLFYLNESGELYLRAAALGAGGALHVVATARDSGTPPRQTSVPVVVHVSERLRSGGGGAARAGVLPAFAAALALLALLVLALLCYIYRGSRKRRVKSSSPAVPEKPAAGGPGPGAAPAGSSPSVSAGASTIAGSGSSLDLRGDPNRTDSAGRQSQRVPSKPKLAGVSPLHNGNSASAALISELTARAAASAQSGAGGAGGPGGAGAGGAGVTLMSDHLAARAGRSGVAWPSATIPARVKKLSWDDAAHSDVS
ncbi:protocadherin-16 [Epargyreus clarus]|uniref:protocadherin-16 n=1 Tax=Epargyreus clarus TaxID=520877 RepID=UPI003C2B3AF7